MAVDVDAVADAVVVGGSGRAPCAVSADFVVLLPLTRVVGPVAFGVVSTRDTWVPASFETWTLYSVAGLEVERRVASVGVWTSAMVGCGLPVT